MKKWIIAFSVCLAGTTMAQEKSNLQAMVDTENAFIQMAKDKNLRDAFLFYLAEDAVTTGPNGPRKGLSHIKSQTVKNDWLFWAVGFSDLAASGDFGYNTGPWEYRVNKNDEKAVAFGEFNSVWKKQSDGTWKNVVDIGIDHGAPKEKIKWSTSSHPPKSPSKNTGSHDEILKVENDFLNALSADHKAAYQANLSSEARIMYAGYYPFLTDLEKEKFINEVQTPVNIKLVDGEMASSGDMGYVYGSETVSVNQNGKSENKKATYLRIWKKEGNTWKIVLDVGSF